MSEIIDKHAQTIEGGKESRDITLLTLSTCMWCKKCKRWLNERDVKYRYVDLDKIPHEEKAKILDFLKETYNSRISYPFMICDEDHVVGYDPGKYEKLMKGEGL